MDNTYELSLRKEFLMEKAAGEQGDLPRLNAEKVVAIRTEQAADAEPPAKVLKVYTVDELRSIVSPIAKRHSISRVFLFGSYAWGEATPCSDVDLRVDADTIHSLFDLGGLYAELEATLGKSLNLVTANALRQNLNDPATRKFVRSIKSEELLLYEHMCKGNTTERRDCVVGGGVAYAQK